MVMKWLFLASMIFTSMAGIQLNKTPEKKYPDYPADWQEIEQMMADGLLEEASKKIESVFNKAIADGNHPQIIKSLLKWESVRIQKDENGLKSVISRLHDAIQKLEEPSKSVLYSCLAECYYQLSQQNQSYGRGKIGNVSTEQDSMDLDSWSMQNLMEKARHFYHLSLKSDFTKREKLIDFEAILNLGSDTLQDLSIYDLLCRRTINFYKNSRIELLEFDYSVSKEEAFSDLDRFLALKLNSDGPWTVFQNIVRHHIETKNKTALLRTNLTRLHFGLMQFQEMEDVDLEYLKSLDRYYEQLNDEKDACYVLLSKLEYLYTLSEQSFLQQDRKEAYNFNKVDELCDKILTLKPDGFVQQQISQFKSAIRSKLLEINIESVYPSGQPILYMIRHRNVFQTELKLFKLDISNFKEYEGIQSQQFRENLLKSKPFKIWKENWPQSIDFRTHQVDLKMDPLPPGQYMLVGDLSTTDQNIPFVFFQVSDLAVAAVSSPGTANRLIVADRNSGEPLQNVQMNYFLRKFDGRRNYEVKEVKSRKKSDKHGMIEIKDSYQLNYLVQKGKDRLWGESWLGDQNRYEGKEYKQVHFFTDRSIYRPGQTIYFKTLCLQYTSEGFPKVVENKKFEILLRDANFQIVGKLELKTNQYGSASGSFVLPKNILKGYFQLNTDNGYLGLRVEEYKRPNFEVQLEPLQGEIKLAEQINILGRAQSFNKIPIIDAKVTYRIYRNPVWDYYDYFYRSDVGRSSEKVLIQSGETQTDKNGKFDFDFLAKPSSEVLEKIQKYQIEVDVASTTGETQSSQIECLASNESVFIKTNLEELMSLESLSDVNLSATNLSGQNINAKFTIRIYEIKNTPAHLKKRYWDKADIFKFSKNEFKKWFPNDVYSDEVDPLKVEKGALVFETNFSGKDDFKLRLNERVKSLFYFYIEVEAVSEKGAKGFFKKNVSIFQQGKSLSSKTPQIFTPVNELTPGDQFTLGVNGPKEKMYLFGSYNSRSENSEKWYNLTSQTNIKFNLSENEGGRIAFTGFVILHNRYYPISVQNPVIWSSKKLQIQFESFRNRMLPGQDEEWVLKIKYPDSLGLKAEVLASLYDRSLDGIQSHRWVNQFWPDFNRLSQVLGHGFNHLSVNTMYEMIPPGQSSLSMPVSDILVPEFRQYYAPVMMDAVARSAGGIQETAQAEGGKIERSKSSSLNKSTSEEKNGLTAHGPPIRSNLNETVFFYPHLTAQDDGSYRIKFKMNEALTKWHFQILAHTADMKTVYESLDVITDKPLQIKPFYPRFLRSGDTMQLSALVSNTSAFSLNLIPQLQITDLYGKHFRNEKFKVKASQDSIYLNAGESKAVFWTIMIPQENPEPVLLRFFVKSEQYSDGEENLIPVITNRKLITSTTPMYLTSGQSKEFKVDGLKSAFESGAQLHQVSLEFSSSPIWYAIQSLPYIAEFPHECSEQLMSRIFANALGSHVLHQFPKVKTVIQQIQREGTNISALEKNAEFKSALLMETPWVLDAMNETEQMRRIALLMDFNKMSDDLESTFDKLIKRQNADGSFSWFPGSWPDRFITQHIITQISHLEKLGVANSWHKQMDIIKSKARNYLDSNLEDDYNKISELVKSGKAKWEDQHIYSIQLQYLYTVSYSKTWLTEVQNKIHVKYFMNQLTKYWRSMGLYEQAMAAIILNRWSLKKEASLILESLRQRAIQSPENGMYWKMNKSFYWYQLPIETQSLMIEAFYELENDIKSCDLMKLWLLKNKQTQHWGTTKATSFAIYALLQYGTDWTDSGHHVKLRIGKKDWHPEVVDAGTLYFKTKLDPDFFNQEVHSITADNPNKTVAWGACYVQYWQDLDKVAKTDQKGLYLDQELFFKTIENGKIILKPLTKHIKIKKSDPVVLRCVIKSDRAMEYVHLKMMHASGLEPLDQLSKYEWNNGFGYYKSPGDLSTDFFISYLPQGTFVIEYEMRAVFSGQFSNGVSTIQCMYAPEFAANGRGIRFTVE